MLKNFNVGSFKVALVHDYLRDYGGAERVLEALHQIFPDAPVYVAFKDDETLGLHAQNFKGWDIRQSWLTEIPFYQKLFSPLRIWAPNYFQDFDLNEYDLVISSSNAYFAKAVNVRKNDPNVPDAVHICYCHTPARSLYGYSTMTNWKKNPIIQVGGTLINHYLRVIDVKIAQKVDYFIANSAETAARIKKFYRRDSTIIFPPVNIPTAWIEVEALRKQARQKYGSYYLYVNRLAFAKHPEMAVEVCTNLNLPLKIVGSGKLRTELEKTAGSTVKFLGAVDDQELAVLYAGATALLYPVEDEDFGIVPIEAMGYGVPVIAHRSGGPQETIQEGKTGLFFDQLTTAGLTAAIKRFQAKSEQFSAKEIHHLSEQFSVQKFNQKITNFIENIFLH